MRYAYADEIFAYVAHSTEKCESVLKNGSTRQWVEINSVQLG